MSDFKIIKKAYEQMTQTLNIIGLNDAKIGIEYIGFNQKWANEINPRGLRLCHMTVSGDWVSVGRIEKLGEFAPEYIEDMRNNTPPVYIFEIPDLINDCFILNTETLKK